MLPDDPVGVGDEDGEEAEGGQEEAVPHVGHDVQGINSEAALGSQGRGGEELGAVGENPLEDAGEDIQEGRRFSRVHPVLRADFLRHVSGYDDGYGVVGGGAVYEGHEDGDAHLGGLRIPDALLQFFDEPGNAAVVGNHFRNAAAEEGEEEGFIHAGEAGPDLLGEGNDGEAAPQEADDAGQENACHQHEEYN